jgi:integrase
MAGIKPYKDQKNEWVLRYDSSDPRTGERRQHKNRFTGTKREANKYLQRILGEIESGSYSDLGNITLKQYLDKWIIAYCTPANLQPKTIRSYASTINNHIIPYLGRHKLNNLKAAHIADYYALMSKPRTEGGAGLSPTTVLYHHRILHQALKHAVNQDYLKQNPVAKVQPPRKNQPDIKVLSVEQARYLITRYSEEQIYLPVFLALMTGMRVAEIAALRWQNVDFDNRTLSVTNALQRQENRLVLKEPKTKKSRRFIPVPEQVVVVLKKERERQDRYRETLGEGYDCRDFVCAWEDGKPYDPEWIGKQWVKLVASDNKIPNGVRFHDLRHTHATILLSQNINLKVIQERLGHESIVTTGDIYSHVTPGIQQAAADVLENLFSSKNST